MNYKEKLLEAVEKDLREYIPEELWGYSTEIQQVTKSYGVTYEAIVFKWKNRAGYPILNTQPLIQMLESGSPMESVLKEIAEVLKSSWEQKFSVDVRRLTDYEYAKAVLMPALSSAEKKDAGLKNCPVKEIEDIVVYYRLVFGVGKSFASVVVTNEMMEIWEIDSETLYADAVKNAAKNFPAKITPIEPPSEIGTFDEKGIYVITNNLACYGAGCIFYPELLQYMANSFGESFYIVPTSVEEVLLIKKSEVREESELQEVVAITNAD